MSEPVRMCDCGGRALLDDEALCPSCQRTQKSILWQLGDAKTKVGQTGAVLGKAVEQVRSHAQSIEVAAAPLVRTGVELAKTHGVPALKAALNRAEARGETALRIAVPLAERLLARTKAYLDRK